MSSLNFITKIFNQLCIKHDLSILDLSISSIFHKKNEETFVLASRFKVDDFYVYNVCFNTNPTEVFNSVIKEKTSFIKYPTLTTHNLDEPDVLNWLIQQYYNKYYFNFHHWPSVEINIFYSAVNTLFKFHNHDISATMKSLLK